MVKQWKETMTTQVSETRTTLEATRTLAPAIVARSEEIDRGRRAPPDLVEELTTAAASECWCPAATAAPSSTSHPRCG